MNVIQKAIQELEIGDIVLGTDESNTIIPTPILGWFNKADNVATEILVSLHMKYIVVVNHWCCPARKGMILSIGKVLVEESIF